MRFRLILLSACLLSACGPETPPPSSVGAVAGPVLDAAVPVKPVDVANKTTLDERLGVGVTLAYTTASRLGTALAAAGLIDKAEFKKLDQRGYDGVLAVKKAYDAGNASSYTAAIDRVNAAVTSIKSLVR